MILCIRGSGDVYTDQVSDPLLTTLPAMLARARQVLDAGEPLQPITLVMRYDGSIETGDMVQVQDELQGQVYMALVDSLEPIQDGVKQKLRVGLVRYEPA